MKLCIKHGCHSIPWPWLKLFRVPSHIRQCRCQEDLLASPPADWRRQPGRPHITWLSTVQQDLKHYSLRSPKQQIWLRTTLCGGWCRRMALRNVRVACQKRRRRHLIYNNYYYVIYSQFLLPFIDSFPFSSVHALNMWACPILYFFLFLIFVHFNNQTSNFWDETLLHHNIGGYTPFCLWPPAKFPDFPWPSKSVRTVIKPDRKGRKGVWTKGGADAWHHPGIWQVCLCDRGTITETHGICRPNKELQHWFVT